VRKISSQLFATSAGKSPLTTPIKGVSFDESSIITSASAGGGNSRKITDDSDKVASCKSYLYISQCCTCGTPACSLVIIRRINQLLSSILLRHFWHNECISLIQFCCTHVCPICRLYLSACRKNLDGYVIESNKKQAHEYMFVCSS
jgi:hypothetical protein